MWTSSGTGSFDDDTSPNAIYAPDANDIANGNIDLTLTVDATGVCPQESDMVIVNVSQPISAGSFSIQSSVGQAINNNVIAASSINAGDIITTSVTQVSNKGVALVLPDGTIDYTADIGTVGADSFQYEICNQCSLCSIGTVSINIVNEPPTITLPSAPITTVVGQSVTVPFRSFLSDLNDNIDLNSIQIISGPTSNAISTFDSNFDLTIDYSGTPFAGTDQLTIEVCDLLGACAQTTLTIEVDGEITVHNGISPNGDDKNDYLDIQNIEAVEPNNKVSIFNRWGDKVFQIENYVNTDPTKRFNGESDKGKALPSGVYFYRVEFTSGSPALEGYLTLKR